MKGITIKKNIICLFGLPGSGKSTFSKNLSNKLNYKHIELGEKLRILSNSNNCKSDKAKNIITNGIPITNDILSELLKKEYQENNNIIFDGFPRNISQYRLLKYKFKFKSYNIIGIFLETSIHNVKSRLQKRKICSNCNLNTLQNIETCPLCKNKLEKRTDDYNIKTIHKRFKNFKNLTKSTIKLFSKEQPLVIINNRNIKVIPNLAFNFLRKNNVK